MNQEPQDKKESDGTPAANERPRATPPSQTEAEQEMWLASRRERLAVTAGAI